MKSQVLYHLDNFMGQECHLAVARVSKINHHHGGSS